MRRRRRKKKLRRSRKMNKNLIVTVQVSSVLLEM